MTCQWKYVHELPGSRLCLACWLTASRTRSQASAHAHLVCFPCNESRSSTAESTVNRCGQQCANDGCVPSGCGRRVIVGYGRPGCKRWSDFACTFRTERRLLFSSTTPTSGPNRFHFINSQRGGFMRRHAPIRLLVCAAMAGSASIAAACHTGRIAAADAAPRDLYALLGNPTSRDGLGLQRYRPSLPTLAPEASATRHAGVPSRPRLSRGQPQERRTTTSATYRHRDPARRVRGTDWIQQVPGGHREGWLNR